MPKSEQSIHPSIPPSYCRCLNGLWLQHCILCSAISNNVIQYCRFSKSPPSRKYAYLWQEAFLPTGMQQRDRQIQTTYLTALQGCPLTEYSCLREFWKCNESGNLFTWNTPIRRRAHCYYLSMGFRFFFWAQVELMQLALRGLVLAVLVLFTACLSLTWLHVHRRCTTVNATDLIFHTVTCQYSTVLQYFMMQQWVLDVVHTVHMWQRFWIKSKKTVSSSDFIIQLS